MKCARAWGVIYGNTGVGFWLLVDKYAQAEAAEETGLSAGNQEGFDLLCVASSNWASELSEMRKKKYPRCQ